MSREKEKGNVRRVTIVGKSLYVSLGSLGDDLSPGDYVEISLKKLKLVKD